MRLPTPLLITLLALATACGGGGSPATGAREGLSAAPSNSLPADAEILQKAYDVSYTVPAGFFIDERAATTGSYTIHHVLDPSNSYEMCSDDVIAAQSLEEADNDARAVNGYYVASYETDRYYEFVRELSYAQGVGNVGDPTSPGYARVFKCAHTDREGVDRNLLNGYSGRIDPERLDGTSLKDFTEYLWQFRFFDATYKKVIASYSSANGSTLRHTLLLAFVHNQGQDACDRVDVVAWHFDAEPAGGEVTRTFEILRSFDARIAAGIPAFCQ